MMRDYIQRLENKENLSESEIQDIMHLIMSGKAADEDIESFLMALREKGPTVDEITGAVKIMRRFVVGINSVHPNILDTCGTGGDKKNTFNISTLTALVVASTGVIVAKHGNRSVSSQCGSADILEALGVNLAIEEKHLKECLDKVGIAFLFAQKLHPAMKNVAAIRKKLKVETIFNILGPLTNPANATHQMMGVYNRDLIEPLAHVLNNLGLKRALVVHGSDGLDEITTTGKTYMSDLNGTSIMTYDIDPEEIGIARAVEKDLLGGDLKVNVAITEALLKGEKGAKRDIVVLNTAYALYIAGKVKDVSSGLAMAQETIDKGMALSKLQELKDFTNSVR